MRLRFFDWGKIDYQSALAKQKEMLEEVRSGLFEAGLVFCRHFPVITLGRSAKPANILVSGARLAQEGVAVYPVERGGDVTYHGPGQLTVYPIFSLASFKKDLHLFLRGLEETVILAAGTLGIKACRRPGLTGVWVGEKKLSSIGISVRDWVTFHGLSLNVEQKDLDNFRLIRPCGMDIEMTALDAQAPGVGFPEAKRSLRDAFDRVFCKRG